ncbi:two-component system histidine kinase PnpS [Pradoshia sp.]|uniref:two-component system histidine kinase PnpS n=1 Tax=Pradoshia sp. TaxID=2651281 RepID=UPI003F06659A
MKKSRRMMTFEIASAILIISFLFGLLLGKVFTMYLERDTRNDLKNAAQVIEWQLADLEDTTELNSRLEVLSKELGISILLTDRDGEVLSDKRYVEEGTTGEELALYQAKLEEFGDHSAEPVFGELHDDGLFYYISPIQSDEGILLVGQEKNVIMGGLSIWTTSLSFLAVAFIVIMLFVFKIIKKYFMPVDSAYHAVQELTKGNYRARTYIGRNKEARLLNDSINQLARDMQEMKIAYDIQKDRLSTLIENMGSALLLIDDKGYINMVNRAYLNLFKENEEDYLSELYYKVIHREEVNALIEEIFMVEQKIKKQIVLTIGLERKNFEVYGAPIIGPKGEWKGIILVFHDITELKKLETVRKQFVANVSHELNTPVTSIKGFTETLIDGAKEDKDTLNHFLSIILKESNRLQALIKELLELSKVEQQGFQLDLQKVDIVPVLRDTYEILEKKAAKKNIQFVLNDLNQPIVCETDPFRIQQVIINLVSNAISYTPADGKVTISASEDVDKVYIKIADTGIGIDEEELPRIFERFYRVDKDRSRESGGTGLGLAIVKHILEAQHGEITIDSKLNEGSTFTVIIPKEQHTGKGK